MPLLKRKPRNGEDFLGQVSRYGIVSKLQAGPQPFSELRRTLGLTDGNLAIHLQKLESKGYVSVEKEFVDRKPRSTYTLTAAGRAALETYLGTSGVVH